MKGVGGTGAFSPQPNTSRDRPSRWRARLWRETKLLLDRSRQRKCRESLTTLRVGRGPPHEKVGVGHENTC